ncbi:MAG: alpha/beta hydrolase [Acidobacteria bacterium]|nr:alpha/beta hydrolase [Acidobacteriota bacterium]
MKAHEGFITLPDGVRLFYRMYEHCGGQPIFLPNGLYFESDFSSLREERSVVIYDLRNRGCSDAVSDDAKLARGVLQDADDLEQVRHHFGFAQIDLLAHSYVAVVATLYAMGHPERVRKLVQIGPAPADAGRLYETSADGVTEEVMAAIGQLQKNRATQPPEEFCRSVWAALGHIYVANAEHAPQAAAWGRCELENERNFMRYFLTHVQPSLQRLKFAPEDFARVMAQVLVIHGRKDRSAPWGGGRDWAAALPDARLLTVGNACHAPWLEEPTRVISAIEQFLGGRWPEGAEKVANT